MVSVLCRVYLWVLLMEVPDTWRWILLFGAPSPKECLVDDILKHGDHCCGLI